MLFVYGGIAAGLSLGEQGSSPGLDGRQKSSRDLSFLAAEAFFSEGSAFPLWLNRNERAPHAAQWRRQSFWRQQVCVVATALVEESATAHVVKTKLKRRFATGAHRTRTSTGCSARLRAGSRLGR